VARAFDAFVVEIKCHLGSAIPLIGNHEDFLSDFRLELSPDFFHGARGRFPAADAVRRIAVMRERDIQGAQEIGVHGQQTQAESKQDAHVKKAADGAARFQAFGPKGRRQHSEADERQHVPIRRGLVVK
jgi:hypothetical protein